MPQKCVLTHPLEMRPPLNSPPRNAATLKAGLAKRPFLCVLYGLAATGGIPSEQQKNNDIS